jgi:hypothetical protein
VVQLPKKSHQRTRVDLAHSIEVSEAGRRIEREGPPAAMGTVALRVVDDDERKARWNEFVHRYHPLRYTHPFGYRLRYFIASEQCLAGCKLAAGATKRIGVRNPLIGWNDRQVSE